MKRDHTKVTLPAQDAVRSMLLNPDRRLPDIDRSNNRLDLAP